MINRLDVLAPFTWVEDHELTRADDWHIKNHPKLHMTKLWEPDGDGECYDIVYNLWIRERSLQLLNMLVPAGYTFSSLDAEGHSWDDPYFHEPPPKALPKVRVIVESQATVFDIKHILVQGWDVVALPGSRLVTTIDSDTYEAHHIEGKAKKWESDGDYLY